MTLVFHKEYPQPHLIQHAIDVLLAFMDSAECLMGIHEKYYVQEIKIVVMNEFELSWLILYLNVLCSLFIPFGANETSFLVISQAKDQN